MAPQTKGLIVEDLIMLSSFICLDNLEIIQFRESIVLMVAKPPTPEQKIFERHELKWLTSGYPNTTGHLWSNLAICAQKNRSKYFDIP